MKIRNKSLIISFFTLIFLLSGCLKTQTTSLPPGQKTLIPSNTFAYPTVTSTPIFTSTTSISPTTTPTLLAAKTAILTPMPSLKPEEAQQEIKNLLHNSNDCAAPCFWGITPMQTSINEAQDILSQLGLKLQGPESHHEYNRDYDLYGTNFSFDNGFKMIITLTVSNDIVTDINTIIDPEKQQTGIERIWSAYSPETMIQRYGQPSKVDLFLGRTGPQTSFDMVLYFDEIDTIAEYTFSDIDNKTIICPLKEQMVNVRTWMGKNPYYPPFGGDSLEKTTGLTLESFTNLLIGNPEKACFQIIPEMFTK